MRLHDHHQDTASAPALHRRLGETAIGVVAVGTALVCLAAIWPSHDNTPAPSPFVVNHPRVVVLKGARVLHLFDGPLLVRTYPVDLGLTPVGDKVHEGDCRTPIGEFHVVTKNAASPYHRFLGIDYPHPPAVERGLRDGLITPGEASSMRDMLRSGRCPDWGSALGGGIGLHGHRQGRDWTAGCIALSDAHIAELYAVLRVGDPVEILP